MRLIVVAGLINCVQPPLSLSTGWRGKYIDGGQENEDKIVFDCLERPKNWVPESFVSFIG